MQAVAWGTVNLAQRWPMPGRRRFSACSSVALGRFPQRLAIAEAGEYFVGGGLNTLVARETAQPANFAAASGTRRLNEGGVKRALRRNVRQHGLGRVECPTFTGRRAATSQLREAF